MLFYRLIEGPAREQSRPRAAQDRTYESEYWVAGARPRPSEHDALSHNPVVVKPPPTWSIETTDKAVSVRYLASQLVRARPGMQGRWSRGARVEEAAASRVAITTVTFSLWSIGVQPAKS